jgi:hypothetical protein
MGPSIEDIKNLVKSEIKVGEQLVNYFGASTPYKYWLFIFIGPLYFLLVTHYLIAITDHGVHFYRLKMQMFSAKLRVANHDFFAWNEIEKVKVGWGLILATVRFRFSNGKKLKLKCQVGGVKHIPKLDKRGKELLALRRPAA